MPDIRPILLIVGSLLIWLGAFMSAPMLIDYAAGDDDWRAFAISALITIFIGGGLVFANRGAPPSLSIKQGFLLTVASWVALVTFAALPLYLGSLRLSPTDAFFEAMSGLTTTGATVIVGLDDAPRGILLWRALLQWLGGVGIIIMAIAVLPMLKIGGMQLFKLESSDNSEKILPRASQFAASIAVLYTGLTLACSTAYWMAGLSGFDAIAHAMTTVATGGFSTRDASFAAFYGQGADMIAVVFMILGSLPFGLYLIALRGAPQRLFLDSQVIFFIAVALGLVATVAAFLVATQLHDGADAARLSAFNVVSIMTGTGYASTDYNAWGPFAVSFFFIVMFVGGCAGSTSCGLKIFRLQIALAALKAHALRMAYPHGVITARYNGKPITDEIFASVLNFFLAYFAIFGLAAAILSVLGLDPITAFSAAGSAIANVGPGLGDIIGPAGAYADLPDSAKWILSLAMLLGRLELLTVLVLFLPSFWRD